MTTDTIALLTTFRTIRLDPCRGNPVELSEAFVAACRRNDPVWSEAVARDIDANREALSESMGLPPGGLGRIAKILRVGQWA